MTDRRYMTRVPVASLRKGLYVAETDRPWTEIPLMFQGFEIREDDELEVLRSHCQFVYVDTERSRADAVTQLSAQSASSGGGRAAESRPVGSGLEAAFGDQRHPDPKAFRELVREAYESRSHARDAMDDMVRRVRRGRNLDVDGTRHAVDDLVDAISGNASAALWLTNLKSKDEYTSIHSVNVCVLALAFGAHFGFGAAELQWLGVGALLHDIGKVRTPPELLERAGPLTPDEFEVIKRHAQDGYDIVSASGGVDRESLEIIRLHHERLDGTGYPFGLQGTAVPLHVRIVGLADAYDAMTSPRSYRDALPGDQVLQRLYNEAENQFGARPVQEFIRCVGIYPVGSLVELDNGAAGIVIGTRQDRRLQPTVLLVRTPDGDFYRKRVLINLAADDDAGDAGAGRQVRRVLDPGSEGIDVAGIVAIEFGLDTL